jgi:hypothetical protein
MKGKLIRAKRQVRNIKGMSGTEHTFEVIPAVSAVFSSMTAPATGRFS